MAILGHAPPAGLDEAANARLQAYFTALAPAYAQWTGHATQTLLAMVLDSVPLGLNERTNVHDNAAGPGTATAALLDWCRSRAMNPPEITATDCNAGMVAALERDIAQNAGWGSVKALIMDSHALAYDDDHFKFVFCNFSVFTFARPLKALREIHRTLKPTGIAVITCWKTWAVDTLIARAIQIVKNLADQSAVPVPGAEFAVEGYLAWVVEAAGWERGKIKTLERRVVLKDEHDLEGLNNFMTGECTAWTRASWTEEERTAWPAAVRQVVGEAKQRDGGLVMEAWVVLARKWDALYA